MMLKESTTSADELAAHVSDHMEPERSASIYKLAREALKEGAGNRTRAVTLLVDKIRRAPELSDEILWIAARYFVRLAEHGERTKLKRPQPSPAAARDDASGLVAVADITRRWLDSYTLEGSGVLLGNATHADLTAAIKLHDTRSASHAQSAAFLKKVVVCVKPGKRVRDTLTDEAITELWEKVSC